MVKAVTVEKRRTTCLKALTWDVLVNINSPAGFMENCKFGADFLMYRNEIENKRRGEKSQQQQILCAVTYQNGKPHEPHPTELNFSVKH